MGIRKYIGDKAFYKMTLTVAIPMMLQNLITNFVSMLDNFMVGSVGTEEISAVSISNQLIFVFNLAVFGALSGAGIFTSQFHGKKDVDGIRYTFRYKTGIGLLLLAAAIVIFLTLDDNLISLYLHDNSDSGNLELTLKFAKQYLAIMLWGLLPFVISQIFSSTLRETGETLVPMFVGFAAVAVNCCLNYLLIFGKCGLPVMGVRGAALATVISRYVECIIIVAYTYAKHKRFEFINGALKSLYIPKKLFTVVSVKGLPLLLNEFLWSAGMSLLSVGYSLYGLSVVAGYSISSTIVNLFNIAFLTLGSSIGIIVGKQLGAGELEEAVDTDRKLIVFSVVVGAIIAVGVFFAGSRLPELYNTSEESKRLASYFIKVCACVMPITSLANAMYFTLRSGGKTIITFFFDCVYVLAIPVPLVFLLYYVFHLPIVLVFPITQGLDFFKCVIGYVLVKKRLWVNNIVE